MPTATGTYSWVALYSGDTNNAPVSTACGDPAETVTVGVPPTSVATSLSGGGQSGTSISVPTATAVTDSATLSGTNAASATGTVTYDVYSDSGCTTAVSSGSPETITTPGTLPASSPVTLATAGAFYWLASYSGDTNNAPSKSTCGPTGEVETVTTAATGYIEICKAAAPGLSGDFRFRVDGHTYKVPVGACSPLIKLPPGKVAVTELRRHGSQLVGVATQPTGRLISVNLPTRTALVKVVPGGIARQTIVTFTNKETATGTLKICKVAGHGVRVGTKFTFNVGTQMVTVPAGPGPAGYCKVVGAFPRNAPVTITEASTSGLRVTAITVSPTGRQKSVDLSTGTVKVQIRKGVTEVTYTNAAT
jgi:hypothetical protein